MRFVIFSLFIVMVVGCQTASNPPAAPLDQHSVGAGEPEHDDHDDHKEGFVTLTPAQKEQLKLTTQVVVLASGQSTGVRPGRLEANPDRKVVISSQVSGILQQLHVQVGAEVKAGSPVAVIASPEVTSLQTDFHEAEVEADLARKELKNKLELFREGDDIQRPLEQAVLEVAQAQAGKDTAAARLESMVLKNERLETLLQDGIASQQQVEESRAERKALEAELAEAEVALKVALSHKKREKRISESSLKVKAETFPAEARLARATERMTHVKEILKQMGADPEEHTGLVVLTSPISGTVVERSYSRGELVTPGKPLAVVVDASQLWAWVDLQRSDLSVVGQGDPLTLSLVDQPDKIAQGYLDYISPQIEEKTQTLRGRVVLTEPPQGFQLGAFVNVIVTDGAKGSATAIPQKAVQFVEGQTVVYVREGEGYQRTSVSLGASVGDELVVAYGVKVGQVIVVGSVEQLKSLDLSDTIGGHSH